MIRDVRCAVFATVTAAALTLPAGTANAQQIGLLTVSPPVATSLARVVVLCGVVAYDAPVGATGLFVRASNDAARPPDLIIVLNDQAGRVVAETYGDNLPSASIPATCQRKPTLEGSRQPEKGMSRLFATYDFLDWPQERQITADRVYRIDCYFRGQPINCQTLTGREPGTVHVSTATTILNLISAVPQTRRSPAAAGPPASVYYVTGQYGGSQVFNNERASIDATVCKLPTPQLDREGNGCYMQYGEYGSPSSVSDATSLRQLILSEHPGATQVLVYVHGFNNSFMEAVAERSTPKRMAQRLFRQA